MNVQKYIESGILESYVTGSASDEEVKQLLHVKEIFPEIKNALYELEVDMERIAEQMAIKPPPNIWLRIEGELNELATIPDPEPLRMKQLGEPTPGFKKTREQQFIEVESESSHMRIHKNWKLVFAAVFVLSKIFLGLAIYFYLENRQAQQQIQDLKLEMRQLKVR